MSWKDAYNKALNLLARREHSRKELFEKLKKRDFIKADIDEALEMLIERDLQSDHRFAQSYLQGRKNKGYGPVRIHQELREKGIDDTLINELLNFRDETWCILANAVRQKKFGNQKFTIFKERAKQMKFLQYRGFTQEQINYGVKG